MTYKFSIGVDTSKQWLDVVVLQSYDKLGCEQIENNPKSIRNFFKKVVIEFDIATDECIVCVEHTGIYNDHLLAVLMKLGMNVCVENAVQIKRSYGLQRGKNDQVDAHRIAEYAMRFSDKLRLYSPPAEHLKQLRLLSNTRKRLLVSKVRIQQPLNEGSGFIRKADTKYMSQLCKEPLQALEKAIENIEKQINQLIQADSKLTRQVELITSVPGVGNKTAVELLIRTNGFTDFQNAKQLACYAGIAPFEHQSGSSIKGRSRVSHRANKSLKTLLHLCAMAAIRTKGELQDYYHKKVAEGKNKMCVINIIRNKLLHRVFAVVKNQVMYQKNYHHSLVKP